MLRRHAALWSAIVLLNASLTFYNVWPTPKIHWQWHLSAELAAAMLGLALVSRLRPKWMPGVVTGLTVMWVLLVVGRYADTTAPALYGRDINLFWDVRHLRAVAEMMTDATSRWLIGGIVVGVIALLVVIFIASRWALRQVAEAMTRPFERRLLQTVAIALLAVYAAQQAEALPEAAPGFSPPVVKTYARQVRLALTRLTADGLPPPVPGALDSDLAHVRGADVFLIFVESYGSVSYDRFGTQLAASRDRFEDDVAASGREVVSAFVDSPTFGGSSWLAHVSLMSGVETRDEDTNVVLMAQKRDTLVSTFARRGYHTVAVMPGLQSSWPEGTFYGFDEIYNIKALDYRGPRFGWWTVPDQFALAKLDALEAAHPSPKAPLFVFFPTTSTHAPFGPAAPYQPDWVRLLSEDPYDSDAIRHSLAQVPDWMDLAPPYINSMSYMYASIGGYLRHHTGRPLVLVVIGDHQPASAVTGEGAPWEVPVHVIASKGLMLEQLTAHGFRPGLTPTRPRLGAMHELLPTLLGAFGSTQKDTHAPKQEQGQPTS